jgi:hypothetical protein
MRNNLALSRVFLANPIPGREMTANVSTWLRAFRSPLQRAYPRQDEPDRDFADLLRQADARTRRDAPASACPPRKG